MNNIVIFVYLVAIFWLGHEFCQSVQPGLDQAETSGWTGSYGSKTAVRDQNFQVLQFAPKAHFDRIDGDLVVFHMAVRFISQWSAVEFLVLRNANENPAGIKSAQQSKQSVGGAGPGHEVNSV